MNANRSQGKSRFSRKSLNVIVFVTLVMIILFSQLSPETNDQNGPANSVQNQTSKESEESELLAESSEAVLEESEAILEKNKEVPFDLESLKANLKSIQQVDLSVDSASELKIDHWKSSKGARVYFVNAPEIPIVDVRLVFDAGSARDKTLPGLSNLTNALLSQGTENYQVDELLGAFEELGIQFSVSAYRDMAIVSFRVLALDQYLDKATDLIAEVVGKPRFPEEHLSRLLSQHRTGLEREKQLPGALMSTKFYAELYADHPYGHRSSGTLDSLDKIKRVDLEEFYQRYYVTNNLVVAVVGAIEKEQSEKMVDALTAFLKPGEAAEKLPVPARLDSLRHQHVPFDSNQTHIRVATLTIDKLNPDFYPLYVGNYILGGSGFSSQLNREIRQKRGLSYSVGSGVSPMRERGPFVASLQTKGESATEALNVMMDTIKAFVETGPTESDLSGAKQELTAGFPLLAANNSSVLGYISSIGFYGLPLDYLSSYNARIGSVTLEDVKAAFKKHIDPEKFLVLTVGAQKPTLN